MAVPDWVSEREWLTSKDPDPLIPYQGDPNTPQALAVTVACCERLRGLLPQPAVAWLNAATDVLAGNRPAKELIRLEGGVWGSLWDEYDRARGRRRGQFHALIDLFGASCKEGVQSEPGKVARAEKAVQAAIVRDVYGNPFRPVAFDPSWRTSTAVSLARQMYEAREFSAIPILADALQDAGCENDDILKHCRDPHGVHVRGCWVLDLVLGKE
jgi:hypothetical protein